MKSISTTLFLILILSGCELFDQEVSKDCTYTATVADLSGTDGCGYVFRLENGDYLEPVWQWGWCGTPPLPEGATEDPLWNFRFVEGQRVRLGYEVTEDYASICMVGEQVIVTCIEVIGEEAVE